MNSDKETKKRTRRKYIGIILLILLIAAFTLFMFILRTIYPQSDETIIRQAAGNVLNKDPNDLTDEDFAKITQLDLSGKRCDIRMLKKFINLQELNLGGLGVAKSKRPNWINNLIFRYHIKLMERKYIDLSPIRKLSNIKRINLSGASVKDIVR